MSAGLPGMLQSTPINQLRIIRHIASPAQQRVLPHVSISSMQSASVCRPEALGQPLAHMQHLGCTYLDYNATTPVFPEVRPITV